jgi:hypothetical protein
MTALSSDFETRKQKALERVAVFLGGVHGFPIEDDLALKEIEDACDRADGEPDATERARIVNDAIVASQGSRFVRRFSALNDKLMPHGRWISPTYLVNSKLIEIESLCEQMVALESAGDITGAEKYRDDAITEIARAAMHPTVRAFMNVRATRLPHLVDVAHYLDASALLFYRQDYFAVANVLLPAIERLLVSITGFRLSASGGTIDSSHYKAALTNASMVATPPHLVSRFDAHKAELLRFLFGRFFLRSDKAAKQNVYNASLLNRAFALHLNEPGSYYTYEDCLTYFQVFDLFTEFIAVQHGLELPGAIPDQDPEVLKRRKVYWELILTDWLSDNNSPEKRVLQPTAFYIPEEDRNYLSLHEGPTLNVLLAHAGLAVDALKPTVKVNRDRLALYTKALTMYHSVVGTSGVAETKDAVPESP